MVAGAEMISMDVHLRHAFDLQGRDEERLCLTIIVGGGVSLQLRCLCIFDLVIAEVADEQRHGVATVEDDLLRLFALSPTVDNHRLHAFYLRSKSDDGTVEVTEETGANGEASGGCRVVGDGCRGLGDNGLR